MSFPYSILVGAIVGIINSLHAFSLTPSSDSQLNNIGSSTSSPLSSLPDNILFSVLTMNTSLYSVLLFVIYNNPNTNDSFLTGGIIDSIIIALFVLGGISNYFTLRHYQAQINSTQYTADQKKRAGILGIAIGGFSSILGLVLGILAIQGGQAEIHTISYLFVFISIVTTITLHTFRQKLLDSISQ